MAKTQHTQQMFPEVPPKFVLDYFQAVKRWYDKAHREPKVYELCDEFRPRIGERTLFRHKAEPDNARWLGQWPPRKGQQPELAQPEESLNETRPIQRTPEDHPCRRLQLLNVEPDGSIRTLSAILDLVEGKLHLERLVPAFLLLRPVLMCMLHFHLQLHLVHLSRTLLG